MPGERPLCAKDSDATRTLMNSTAIPCNDSLDAAISSQREDWLKGIRIPIADRLRACGALCSGPIQAAELIYHDFVLQRDSGKASDWDSLVRQFPEYAEQLRLFREADELIEGAIAPSGRSATQLGGYDLLEEVGRGGMGIVYRARERNLERTVAIKRIRAGALADDDSTQRFLKEAKAVSRLNHPNIVHIYCVGDCEGEPFIALEFVEGPTLGERIGGTPLAPQLAGTVAAAVARAVEHAHEHGIIHRDLKPANILLSGPPDGPVPKVTDFGAAKELENATHDERTQFLGTPSYMAPEQVEPKWGAISQLTDVYGIGAVLYEALTGRPPFRADSIGETLRQVVETQPVSPRLLNPAVPRDLETACLKCLRKEPGRRYDSAAALGEDLERYLAGQPIHARPVGSAARVWMWCRRKPGTASLVTVAVLVLIAGIAGIINQWSRAEAARKNALASDLEAQELLNVLIESNPADGWRTFRSVASIKDLLHQAEAHCKNLLHKNPDEIQVRIALTNVYEHLTAFYGQQGQVIEAEASRLQARALWEPLANESGNMECRYWLAVTYSWVDGDAPQFFQSQQRAEAIWQELAQGQPDNLDLMRRIWAYRETMTGLFREKAFAEAWLSQLQESRTELELLVRRNPRDRALRKRLALSCFVLGEANDRTSRANSFWRESYDHYKILIEERPDDLLDNLSLAISCSRLIHAGPTDPYYLEAVPLLDRAGRRLNALLAHEPTGGLLCNLLLENDCCLALCHAKAGETAKAEQSAQVCAGILAMLPDGAQAKPEFTLEHTVKLLAVGQQLREARQPAAALRLTRQAAALCSKLAVDPMHDPSSFRAVGNKLLECSTLANQLGEPTLALEQAELARRTIEAWMRAAPHDPQRDNGLSYAWERIGKARWSLGQRDQAMAAFRESAAIQKPFFERNPSSYVNRVRLSQCYNRLVYYGSSAGDLRTAADAILAGIKFSPNNSQQLAKFADDFAALAEQVTIRARAHLAREDQAERDHYLSESRRLRHAANAATRRAGHGVRAER
ncbi:MAG TPA: serine/threonine-protein kinase [Planctomycetaceae bacterium]|jgi:tRNA A-37 threonylcarbamoyl transferase component Bud32/tetratricopeptide (TPR) repeat protein|nr:serine/threonine-protein kinase [Planctomycetaceae bacterium]